ncbi:hypothetical protein FLPS103535_01260 [Flavobacterium psychrophilum]
MNSIFDPSSNVMIVARINYLGDTLSDPIA